MRDNLGFIFIEGNALFQCPPYQCPCDTVAFSAEPESIVRVFVFPMMPAQRIMNLSITKIAAVIRRVWGFSNPKNIGARPTLPIMNSILACAFLYSPFIYLVISQPFFSVAVIISKGMFAIYLWMLGLISSCFGNYFITMFQIPSTTVFFSTHQIYISTILNKKQALFIR